MACSTELEKYDLIFMETASCSIVHSSDPAERFHLDFRWYFAMRENRHFRECRLQELPDEIADAGINQHNRRGIRPFELTGNAGNEITRRLWRQSQNAVVFAMLDGRFHNMLRGRFYKVGRNLSLGVDVSTHDQTTNRLTHIFGQQYRILGHLRTLAERLEDGHCVANRHPFPQ